jgi:hypothetical protein
MDRFSPLGDPQKEIEYRPQDKQAELVKAVGLWDWWHGTGPPVAPIARNIGYGGAVYGGKTYGIIGLANMCAYAFPGVQMAFFRRTYAEMEGPGGVMFKCYEVFQQGGAKSREGGKHWYWPKTGSGFFLRHCEYEKDVFKQQSADIDILFVDEATHFSWDTIDYLFTRNRPSGDGIIKPFRVLCSNPGNIGHAWYMKLFDLDRDEATNTPGMERWSGATEARQVVNPNDKYSDVFFIPAYLEDNPIGVARDPGYEEDLKERNQDTYEALRWGDWEVFAGQYFKTFHKERHVISVSEFLKIYKPGFWPVWRAVDRGWTHPFFCLWMTMNPANKRVYAIRELSGTEVTDQEQSVAIAMNTPAHENVWMTFAPRDFWTAKNVDGIVKSTADEYNNNGIPVMRADMERVNGWIKVNNALKDGEDGRPMLQFVETCARLIDIMPKLSRDDKNPDDVLKQKGDDPADTLRYGFTNIDMFWDPGGEDEEQNQYPQDEWDQVQGL